MARLFLHNFDSLEEYLCRIKTLSHFHPHVGALRIFYALFLRLDLDFQ